MDYILHGHIGEGAREGGRRDGGKGIADADLTSKKNGKGSIFDLFGNQERGGGKNKAISGSDRSAQFQQARQQTRLENQTKERNNARRQVAERSQEMIKEVMAAVAQQNGVNSQAIQAAHQAIASVAGQSQAGNPTVISGGGGSSAGSIASTLQSGWNNLRGLVR